MKRNKIMYVLLVIVMLIVALLFFKNRQIPTNSTVPSQVAVKTETSQMMSKTPTTQPVSNCAAEINGKPNLGAVCSISELRNEQKQHTNLS